MAIPIHGGYCPPSSVVVHLGAALIPEFTKIFTSPKSIHVKEIVRAGPEGGASLVLLSGLVAGNFSAFWKGLVFFDTDVLSVFRQHIRPGRCNGLPFHFAFGLVAFGMLGMGLLPLR